MKGPERKGEYELMLRPGCGGSGELEKHPKDRHAPGVVEHLSPSAGILKSGDEQPKTGGPAEQILRAMKESRRKGLIDASSLRIRLSELDTRAQQKWAGDSWYFRHVLDDMYVRGHESLAHLCLPRTIHALLARSEIQTISEVKKRVGDFTAK